MDASELIDKAVADLANRLTDENAKLRADLDAMTRDRDGLKAQIDSVLSAPPDRRFPDRMKIDDLTFPMLSRKLAATDKRARLANQRADRFEGVVRELITTLKKVY